MNQFTSLKLTSFRQDLTRDSGNETTEQHQYAGTQVKNAELEV
jgi:hypothetical protein